MKKPFEVLYEDNHLILVNKASGILVQGDKTGDKTLGDYVKEYLREKYNKTGGVYLGIPHRLDRPVSGLVILAKTSKALERMNKMFRNRQIKKTYWAIVKKRPSEEKRKLVHWLIKSPEKNIVRAHDQPKDGALKAELVYRTLGRLNNHYCLEVYPITGRPHQIRVQLAKMGCPIRGDIKYGFSKPNEDKSIHLHARRVYFEHPVKKEALVCVAPLPNTQFWEQYLSFDSRDIRDPELDSLF